MDKPLNDEIKAQIEEALISLVHYEGEEEAKAELEKIKGEVSDLIKKKYSKLALKKRARDSEGKPVKYKTTTFIEVWYSPNSGRAFSMDQYLVVPPSSDYGFYFQIWNKKSDAMKDLCERIGRHRKTELSADKARMILKGKIEKTLELYSTIEELQYHWPEAWRAVSGQMLNKELGLTPNEPFATSGGARMMGI